jgi:hypothetical protein
LSVVTIPEGQHSGEVYLDKEGRCTSDRVKYSHHVSGEALFSLTGQISSEIRRKSVPLRNAAGHLFTVIAQGITEFAAANRPRDRANLTTGRANLTFQLGEPTPEAIRFVGRLYDARKLSLFGDGEPPDRLGPTLRLRIADDDKLTEGFAIANPHDAADQMLIVITCHLTTKVNVNREAVMLFLGGFDPPEQTTDTQCATSSLAFTYPADNFDELQKLLGTIDLRSP